MRRDIKSSQNAKNIIALKTDPIISAIQGKSPDEVAAWAATNVIGLPSAMVTIESLAKAIAILTKDL